MKKSTTLFALVYGFLLFFSLLSNLPFWFSLGFGLVVLGVWKLISGLAWHNIYFLFFITFLSLTLGFSTNKTTSLIVFLILYLTFLSQISRKDYLVFTYQIRLKIFFWFLSFSWFFWIYSLNQFLPFGLGLLLLICGFRLLLQIANNETACLGDNLLQDITYLFVITQFAWLAVLLPLNPFGQAVFLVIWSLYFNERFKEGTSKQAIKNIISQTIAIILISLSVLLLK